MKQKTANDKSGKTIEKYTLYRLLSTKEITGNLLEKFYDLQLHQALSNIRTKLITCYYNGSKF